MTCTDNFKGVVFLHSYVGYVVPSTSVIVAAYAFRGTLKLKLFIILFVGFFFAEIEKRKEGRI